MIIRSLLFMSLMMLIACGGDSKKGSTDNSTGSDTKIKEITFPDNGTTAPSTTTTTQVTPPPAEPPQNAEGVWHYTCPSGCKGGGGAAGPCPTCGATLAHNSAYHGSAGATATPPPAGANPVVAPSTPPVEPPQNASGVWHFTCANGCEGGAGAVGPCAKCGGTLAHNQAYHQ